jgi:hypothetical protein
MPTPIVQPSALAPDCEAYLAANDFFSQADSFDELRVKIFSNDGHYMLTVSSSIGQFDLQAMIVLQKREFARGIEAGKAAKQHEIRAALGLAP